MKLDRQKVRKLKLSDLKDDYGYVDATPEELVGMVWELTKEYCALHGIDTSQPLQKHISRVIRRGELKADLKTQDSADVEIL